MQLRAQKTREAILTAGMRLFSSCGFSGTAVDAVAADAGVNKQRIYAYFGSKQGLFEAVLTEALGNRDGILCPEKSLQEAGAHPERLTEILLEAFWKQHDAHPEFWRLLAWANLENDIDLDKLSGVRFKDNALMRKAFEKAQAAGFFKDIDFENYLFSLFALTFFYVANKRTLRYTLGGKLFDADGFETLRRQLPKLFR
jgi:TetR/AcrR family transcriptional regulator